MAIFNVQMRVSSHFDCPTPISAAPANKGRHMVPLADARDAHCQVILTVGTRGVFVNRVAHGTYSGHVPDAPVLLTPTAEYAQCHAATGLTVRRVASGAVACVAGAAVMAAFVGAIAATLALAHALVPAAIGAITLHGVLVVGTPMVVGSAIWGLYDDQSQWALARARFGALAMMNEMADRARMHRTTADDDKWAADMVTQLTLGHDYVLSHAVMELETLRLARSTPQRKAS